ncbi:trehalase family glycosidase [uncultured Rhodospira sp.]|uniref:MGH1-like glycoside hydrolase domain-containing protein n=1 Tax=uncultured Rhodospira sp. TaxID=1936189 RepID=UPI00260D65FB|nr:trehalase family glycosidase [uncultured Rhodospira sp.]
MGRVAARRLRRGMVDARRLARVVWFGLRHFVLSRLFRRLRRTAPAELTQALMAAKAIEHPPPVLAVTGPDEMARAWDQGFAAVNAALYLNLQKPDHLSAWRHAHPAPSFPAIYLWDSAFIAQIWAWWDPSVAADVLRSVVDGRDGDRLRHFIADFARSPFTQPPLIAWSLERLAHSATPEVHDPWLAAMYAPLRDYKRWLYTHRRTADGLFAWAHAYESGVENAPRFGSRDERTLRDTRRVAAPDFCAYMVLKCEALAAMARRLGREADATTHEADATALREAVNRTLWDEDEGLYFDRDTASGRFVRSRSIASLLPLWAGIPDARQAARLHAHIVDPESFNTLIPLPSVALSDAAFEKDMWRGPVWLNTAFAVVEGLHRYGYVETAAELAFRLCDGVYRTVRLTGHVHEFYDPQQHGIQTLHRKKGNLWKRMTLGGLPVGDFVGWSGLVNTLVIETLFGLRRRPEGLAITPRFPARAAGQSFRLTLPREDLEVSVDVSEGGAVSGRATGPWGETPFDLRFGQDLLLAPSQ